MVLRGLKRSIPWQAINSSIASTENKRKEGYGFVPLGWSGSDQWSEITRDHSRLNEPMHPCPEWIHRFTWSTIIRVISDHWSWSRSSQRNAPYVTNNLIKLRKSEVYKPKVVQKEILSDCFQFSVKMKISSLKLLYPWQRYLKACSEQKRIDTFYFAKFATVSRPLENAKSEVF